MANRNRQPKKRRKGKKPSRYGDDGLAGRTQSILLDSFSVRDLEKWEAFAGQMDAFHWEHYASLHHLRSLIYPKLMHAIFSAAKPFEFKNWKRAVSAKYIDDPLNPNGSVKMSGRFNFGKIEDSKFTPFPALYLAEDHETAFCEKFGISLSASAMGGLTPAEQVLQKEEGLHSFGVSGQFEKTLFLEDEASLHEFLLLISNFEIPSHVKAKARRFNLPELKTVKTVDDLKKALYDEKWRFFPNVMSVPASCQIFGKMCCDAGIEAIMYKSTKTGKPCLAVFTGNFKKTSAFVKLDACPDSTKHKILNSVSAQKRIALH